MSNTKDMSKIKVTLDGYVLNSLVEIAPVNEGNDAVTFSEPDLQGNITKFVTPKKRADFDITVRSGSDDEDKLNQLRRKCKNDSNFVMDFNYVNNSKGNGTGGSGVDATIPTMPTQGLKDDNVFRVTILDYVEREV